MPACKSCGMWYAKVGREELCPLCEQALGRLAGYATPVVHCKNCKYRHTIDCALDYAVFEPTDDSFCSYGVRKDGGADDE